MLPVKNAKPQNSYFYKLEKQNNWGLYKSPRLSVSKHSPGLSSFPITCNQELLILFSVSKQMTNAIDKNGKYPY